MAKLSINLLPGEVAVLEKDLKKRTQLVKISVSVLATLIILTAAALGYRVYQNNMLSEAMQNLGIAKAGVESLSNQEGLLVSLKGRLNTIRTLENQPSKQAQSFNLLTALIPPNMRILAFSVDSKGTVSLSTEAMDIDTMRLFFNNLIDPQTNQGKVSKVTINSLTRGLDSIYRIDVTITL